jgi:hypothetical protein
MDLRKVRNGEWIALAAGILLIVSLFLPWYGQGGETVSGWTALTVIHVFLLICGLFGPAIWFFTAQQPTPAVPLAAAGLGAWASVVAIILSLVRIVDVPADGLGVEYGAFVALAASVMLFVGAWRSLGDERIRRADGSWSHPSEGEIGAGVEVATLPPPRAETGTSGNS